MADKIVICQISEGQRVNFEAIPSLNVSLVIKGTAKDAVSPDDLLPNRKKRPDGSFDWESKGISAGHRLLVFFCNSKDGCSTNQTIHWVNLSHPSDGSDRHAPYDDYGRPLRTGEDILACVAKGLAIRESRLKQRVPSMRGVIGVCKFSKEEWAGSIDYLVSTASDGARTSYLAELKGTNEARRLQAIYNLASYSDDEVVKALRAVQESERESTNVRRCAELSLYLSGAREDISADLLDDPPKYFFPFGFESREIFGFGDWKFIPITADGRRPCG